MGKCVPMLTLRVLMSRRGREGSFTRYRSSFAGWLCDGRISLGGRFWHFTD